MYLTVRGYGEREILIQRSRFIAQVERAENEDEAKSFVEDIRKKHWNATHNCVAYIVGKKGIIQKTSDDGEPGGTAGIPMLEVLRRRKLRDTVIVVTRYFGGIKLGAGGLIRAYSRSAAEGLDAAGTARKTLMRSMFTSFDYTWLGKIENALIATPYVADNVWYTERVKMDILVPLDKGDVFIDWIAGLTNGQAEIEAGTIGYVETDI